ncbi:MAG: DUF362 domain-containing protein [PVC group bacterium]|nr:DUF362 domain-containing protein [PVC group bacterium]
MMFNRITRREFIKKVSVTLTAFLGIAFLAKIVKGKDIVMDSPEKIKDSVPMQDEDRSDIYHAQNGTPEQNTAKVIEMMGGIERSIGKEDIVVIKPNAQWWNQGMTNTNSMKMFIELVLAIPGFKGEVIIAENHHCYGPKNTCNIRGWNTQMRNGDYNYNELIDYFQDKGHANVTKYHWINGGPFGLDDTLKAKVLRPIKELVKKIKGYRERKTISHPREGDGYVWTDIEFTYAGKKTKMSYPIFTSAYSGVRIDFKNGAWKNGKYTGQPVKFINFAVLNHHSDFAGVTSSVKNYLGVVDMTCGYQGVEPQGYHNFHYIGIPGLGGAVGTFMNTIRKADLNIVTAEWVGFGSRTDTDLAAKPKAIIASTDPVALDYYGAKNILYPLGGRVSHLNDPDDRNGPFRKYLELCHAQGIGTLDEAKMNVKKFDFNKQG